MVARKFALQWSGPFLYLWTVNDCLGKICRQQECKQTGKPFQIHLSKLRLYWDPEAYPGQRTDLYSDSILVEIRF